MSYLVVGIRYFKDFYKVNISLLCSFMLSCEFPATNILLLCSIFKRQSRVNICKKTCLPSLARVCLARGEMSCFEKAKYYLPLIGKASRERRDKFATACDSCNVLSNSCITHSNSCNI